MTRKIRQGAVDAPDTNRSPARRRLIKALAAGGAGAALTTRLLPAGWTRPVIDSVLLPAHAQATGFSGSFSTTFNLPASNPLNAGNTILDVVVPRAHAGTIMTTPVDLCVNITNNVADITVLIDGTNLYGATGVAVPFSDLMLDFLGVGTDTIVTTISGSVESSGGNQLVGSLTYGLQSGPYTAPEVMGMCAILVG